MRDYAAENTIIRRNFQLYDAMRACSEYRADYYHNFGCASEGRWKLYYAALDMWQKLARNPETGEWSQP